MVGLDKASFPSLREIPENDECVQFYSNQKERAYQWKGKCYPVDLAFPVLHGMGGEDGWIQGFFNTLRIPCVGSNVEASCLCMNKSLTKILLQHANLPQVPFATFNTNTPMDEIMRQIIDSFRLPVFIKPSHGGSSIGISKCKHIDELQRCIQDAFLLDREIIVEKAIQGREIECSVLGDFQHVRSSIPGEIIPLREFYDYEAKYIENSTKLEIPASLPDEITKKLQQQACFIFRELRCYGMARVDFFIEHSTQHIYLNEVNTMPGFTAISMYPKLWEASGLSYEKLLDELIRLAIQQQFRYNYG